MNDQHHTLTLAKAGSLHNAPLAEEKDDLKILDIGCGSGIWCLQMAEEYPSAKITGMDVAPTQPHNKPENVEWILQDMEQDWPFPPNCFDFIHLSLVHGCVADWDKMMAKVSQHLAPGGFIEHQEFSLCRQYLVNPDGTRIPLPNNVDELPPVLRWGRLMEQAAERRGRIIQLGPRLVDFQRTAGLQNVNEAVYSIPCGTWPADEQQRMIGARNMLNALQGMEGFTMVMFTKVLGWSVDDTQRFVGEVRRDLRDDGMRKVLDLHVVYGQKPDEN